MDIDTDNTNVGKNEKGIFTGGDRSSSSSSSYSSSSSMEINVIESSVTPQKSLKPYHENFEEITCILDFEFKGSPFGFSLSENPIEISLFHLISTLQIHHYNESVVNTRKQEGLDFEKVIVSHKDSNSFGLKKLVENGTKKNLHLSIAMMVSGKNEFPMMVGINVSGLKLHEKSMIKNVQGFCCVMEQNYSSNSCEIVLVSPDILYHNPTFIKSFGACRQKEDILRGLNIEILEIKRDKPPEDSNEKDNVDNLDIASLSLNEDVEKKDLTTNKYVFIPESQEYPKHALLPEILKLQKANHVKQYFQQEQKKPNNDNNSSKNSNNSDNNDKKILIDRKGNFIDYELFEKFIEKKAEMILENNDPVSLDEISITIHNPLKNNGLCKFWKSPVCDPDQILDDYSISFRIKFLFYLQKECDTNSFHV